MKRTLFALGAVVWAMTLTACGDECKVNTDCGSGEVCEEGKCVDDPRTPDCINGLVTCTTNEVCDPSDGECKRCTESLGCNAPQFCDTSANSGEGACKTCTATFGCDAESATPICDEAAGEGAGACVTCTDDQGCLSGVCDRDANNGAGACVGCESSSDCNGANPHCNTDTQVCSACLDDQDAVAQDTGCSAESPICATAGTAACKTCTSELGCEGATPVCDTAGNSGKGACVECTIDDDCTGSEVCDPSSHTCKVCYGDATGCDVGEICDPLSGSGAGACKTCYDSNPAGEQDTGCTASEPVCDGVGTGTCFACVGDADCGGPTPICDTAGDHTCKTCTLTSGCTAPLACDPAAAGGAGACVGCTADTGPTGCEATPTTPHCNTGVTPGECVECVNSTQCTTDPAKTICDSASSACVACNATDHAGCGGATPLCLADQSACVECRNDTDCSASPNGSKCDSAAHVCTSTAKVMVVKVVGCSTASCDAPFVPLSSASAKVFIEEFGLSAVSTPGLPIRSFAMPTAVDGANFPLTMAGSSTTEGGLSRSADGRYVVLAGYAAGPASASVAATTSATVSRIIGRVDSAGNVNTSTQLNASGASFSGNGTTGNGNIRAAASTDGTEFWAVGSNTGVVYAQLGATNGGTVIGAPPTNNRNVHIYGGLGGSGNQLYLTSGAASSHGVWQVGTGTPTTAGQTMAELPGFPNTCTSNCSQTTENPYSFVALDLDATPGIDTIYEAQGQGTAAAGVVNIEKWTLSGATWTKSTTFAPTLAGATGGIGAFGLAGVVENGFVRLFATTSTRQVVTFVDTGATPVVTAIGGVAATDTTTGYRGVAVSPVP